MKRSDLEGAQLEGAFLGEVNLEEAFLRSAYLEEVALFGANLKGAYLRGTDLSRANLIKANLERTNLTGVQLERAWLNKAVLADDKGIGPRLADARWDNANLTIVNWSQIQMLGDEYEARQKSRDGKKKRKAKQLDEYKRAVRANRQLTVALQAQGLNEDAARFAYRAQVLQKQVWWLQMTQRGVKLRHRGQTLGAWLFSWFLFLLAGYGYRLWRSFLAYALVIIGFTTIYYLLGASDLPPLSFVNALGLSMTSFHGRGFFPGVTQLNDPLTILASVEAFVGLTLEATFIATLTQRFFGK